MSRSPNDPIRVLFDTALFGVIHLTGPKTSNRTGIFRVVERTAALLAAMPDVELAMAAERLVGATVAYVRGDPGLGYLRPRWSRRTSLIGDMQILAIEEMRRRGATHPALALPGRAAHKALGVAHNAFEAVSCRVGRGSHAWADVFHSPFDPLPPPSRRSRGVRYVLTAYDLTPQLFPEMTARWHGDRWIRSVLGSIRPEDFVLAISEHTKRDLLDAYPAVTPERVHVTPLAADPQLFYRCEDAERVAAVRARYGIGDAPYVLTVGSLAPHKNIPRLIRAFADLVRAERIGDLHLVLTGAGVPGHEEIVAERGRLGDVASRIVFAGYVDDADLAPLYSGALAFAYPSLYEGFGLPPLEAMQCGVPVVTGDRSSLPEVVGDAGIMVDPHDQDALAQALLDLYRDPARRAELAARGLARARQFTWARYAEQTVAGYRAALA